VLVDGGCLSHTDAAQTATLMDSGTRGDEVGGRTRAGEVGEDLPRGRVHVEAEGPIGLASSDHGGGNREVTQPRVGRGADDYLADLGPGDLAHRDHVPRGGWFGDQGFDRGEID